MIFALIIVVLGAVWVLSIAFSKVFLWVYNLAVGVDLGFLLGIAILFPLCFLTLLSIWANAFACCARGKRPALGKWYWVKASSMICLWWLLTIIGAVSFLHFLNLFSKLLFPF